LSEVQQLSGGTSDELRKRFQILERVAIFFTLPDNILHALARRLAPASATKGSVVVHQGDPGDTMFVVESGRCEVYVEESPGHTITIALTCDEDGRITASLDDIGSAFTQEYAKTFGHEMDEEIEIVSLRATLRTPLPRRASEQRPMTVTSTNARDESTGDAYSFTRGERARFRILQRDGLEPGTTVVGPAIILEETATTYLDADFEAVVDVAGSLLITDTREQS